MDNSQIILAAVQSVGAIEDPAQFQAAVTARAREIYLMTNEKSQVARSLARLTEATVIPGTIVNVEHSKGNDNRAVVTLFTGTDRKNTYTNVADGTEVLRTEWLNKAEGKRMANLAHGLIGHKVLAYKFQEPKPDGSGEGVRMIEHVIDLGLDPNFAQQGQPLQQAG